ncbi:MAG: DEAD/DEAH box helicase [Pseudomonadota bacterium]|nr:DEAD/DEAH box helicase [Pseudomonadota bacterium]
MEKTHLTHLTFAELGLSQSLLDGLNDAGFACCTPIQAQTLPLALDGQDVAGQAQTGTGKTIAFLLAAMHRLLCVAPAPNRKPNQPRAVVVAPTRELVLQIHHDALLISRFTALRIALVYGGVDYEKQRAALGEKPDLLIATPGRLIDYHKQRAVDFRAVEVTVLDEADAMFDFGFIRDIRFLLRRMPPPPERLTLLFSATLSWRVHELAYEHMNNPHIVVIDPDKVTVDQVTQRLYHIESKDKLALLLGLLQQIKSPRVLVFVNTKRGAETVSITLNANGLAGKALSGDVPQKQRQALLGRFARGELSTLIATDVAARGLHIPEVSHVINFDLPQNAEDYVHRIGRTARGGVSGDAISFACEEYVYSLPEIEAFIGHKIPVARVDAQILAPSMTKMPRSRRPRARRPSGVRRTAPANR